MRATLVLAALAAGSLLVGEARAQSGGIEDPYGDPQQGGGDAGGIEDPYGDPTPPPANDPPPAKPRPLPPASDAKSEPRKPARAPSNALAKPNRAKDPELESELGDDLDKDPAAPPADASAALKSDADIDAAVARVLFERALFLRDEGDFESARMLLEESLARSDDGPEAEEARALLATTTRELSERRRPDDETLNPFSERAPTDTVDPFGDDADDDDDAPAEATAGQADDEADAGDGGERSRAMAALLSYGTAQGLLTGAALGGIDDGIEAAPVIGGLLGGGVGLAGTYLLTRERDISAGTATTIGWGGVWGGLLGGAIVDLAGIGTSTPTGVARGAALGGLLGGGAGWLVASNTEPSAAESAFVNSLGLYGTAGALLIGVAIDPVEVEAYTLNAVIGAGVGLGAGLLLSSSVEVSPTRMLWVDLGASLGAAVPWVLIYPVIADASSPVDEQVLGAVSLATMLGGGYLAWHWTEGMAAEQGDERPLATSLVMRSAEGDWHMGVPVPRPAGFRSLTPRTKRSGFAVNLLGGAF